MYYDSWIKVTQQNKSKEKLRFREFKIFYDIVFIPSTCREPTPAGGGFPNPLLNTHRVDFVMGSPTPTSPKVQITGH